MPSLFRVCCCSVSDRRAWKPKSVDQWCLQAAPREGGKSSFAAIAVLRLCKDMELKSVQSAASELQTLHFKVVALSGAECGEKKEERTLLRKQEETCMKHIAEGICAAFGTSAVGAGNQPEAVSTPMDLLNLVVWQSQEEKSAGDQCLQALQDQLGIGKKVDRPSLLQWLAKVRTFSLDGATGELLENPDNQWVTRLHSALSLSQPSPSGGTGQQKFSHPPALLISPPPALVYDVPPGYSGGGEYHLLQLIDQPLNSPLNSQYTSSLSNLVLSPMLPFIHEGAWEDDACRLYFLPVLLIRQSTNDLRGPPGVLQHTASSSSDSFESGLFKVRCGDTVQVPPGLCSQLGSGGQRLRSGTEQAAMERELQERPQLMTFFGALLMVAPDAADTAEVWALLTDSLCRWWVLRVDLSSPLSGVIPCLTGDAGQPRDPSATLQHLLGPSAAAPHVSMTLWRDRCQHVWMAVLSWLQFARDRVVLPPLPPPEMSTREVRHPVLPDIAIELPAPRVQDSLHVTVTEPAETPTAVLGASAVQAQEFEEDDVEEEKSPTTPRRSSRSQVHTTGDAAYSPLSSKRVRFGKGVTVEGTPQQIKAPNNNKKKDKAEKSTLAAKKRKQLDRQQKEEQRKEKQRKEEQEKEAEEKRQQLEKEMKLKKEQRKLARNAKDRMKRLQDRQQRQQSSRPEMKKQPTEAEGVRTRSGIAQDATVTATDKQPAAAVTSGSSRGRKRKDPAEREEKKSLGSVEEGDAERKSANDPSMDVDTDVQHHPSEAAGVTGPPTLVQVYMAGSGDHLSQGHKREVDEWFNIGSKVVRWTPPGKSKAENYFSGPAMDIVAEFNFIRQYRYPESRLTTQGIANKSFRLTDAKALERNRKPGPDMLAQAFVASVGLQNKEVEEGFLRAVRARQCLTNRVAQAREQKDAHHAEPVLPWLAYRGITLTTLGCDRLDYRGNPVDNDTPSHPPLDYPEIEAFRAILKGQSDKHEVLMKQAGSSPQRPQKKIKTAAEFGSASVEQGDDRHVVGGIPVHIDCISEQSASQSAHRVGDARDVEMEKLRAENQRLRTLSERKSEEAGSTPLGQVAPGLPTTFHANNSAPRPSIHALGSTATASHVAPPNAPIQAKAPPPPQSDDDSDAEMIEVPAAPPSANPLKTQKRAPLRSKIGKEHLKEVVSELLERIGPSFNNFASPPSSLLPSYPLHLPHPYQVLPPYHYQAPLTQVQQARQLSSYYDSSNCYPSQLSRLPPLNLIAHALPASPHPHYFGY
jgi:hypothetical protein